MAIWEMTIGILKSPKCWSWNSSTLATWCKELTHLKRPWCWERLKAGGEGDDRGWDGWMTSPTQWTWVWVNSGSWWCTGRPGMLQSMESQSQMRLSDWTELKMGIKNLSESLKQKLDSSSSSIACRLADSSDVLLPAWSASGLLRRLLRVES